MREQLGLFEHNGLVGCLSQVPNDVGDEVGLVSCSEIRPEDSWQVKV